MRLRLALLVAVTSLLTVVSPALAVGPLPRVLAVQSRHELATV